MPTANQAVRFIGCTYASYVALGTYNDNTLYFLSDTKQIFLGNKEYTKSIKVLDAQPNASTFGEAGRLYVYNGNLYICEVSGYTYVWTRVANVNDKEGTVTKVTAGAGLDGGDITETGTISHAVPSGAASTSDSVVDQTAAFGGEVEIVGVSTDEFGHVTAVNVHKITIPEETALDVSSSAETAEDLDPEDTFTVVTEVTKGTGSHDVSVKTKTFKLPEEIDTTYTISTGSTEGTVLVTPSTGSAYEVVVKDWDKLAKLSDISAVFQYKGAVADLAALNAIQNPKTGDVYTVTAEGNQYVYAEGQGWEKFGASVDLTPYALKSEYVPRVSNVEGEVPKFAADGTISSTGFTLGKSVPSDAKFTDTVYEHDQFTAHAKGLYNVQINEEGHVSSATAVTKQDIVDLGIPASNTDTMVKTAPNTTNTIFIAGTTQSAETTGELKVNPDASIGADGSITATAFHGNADSATSATSATSAGKATNDEDGNNIKATYATKEEAQGYQTVWEVI